MKVRRSTLKSVLVAVTALALTSPGADAVPLYDGHPPSGATAEAYDVNRETGAYTPANASGDMHASTVGSAFENQVVAGDLRTEGAKSPMQSTIVRDELPGGGDLRSEAAKVPATPPAGLPTWPIDPKPIVPPGPEPVAATGDGDDPVDWPLVGLLIAGTLALAGGAAFVVGRRPAGHAH